MGEGEETHQVQAGGGAAAAWRRDRFRVSFFFSFFSLTLQTAPLPFVNFLPSW